MKTRKQIQDECMQRRRDVQKEFDRQLQLLEEAHRDRWDEIDRDEKDELNFYCSDIPLTSPKLD